MPLPIVLWRQPHARCCFVRHADAPCFEVWVERDGAIETRCFERDEDAADYAIQELHRCDGQISEVPDLVAGLAQPGKRSR